MKLLPLFLSYVLAVAASPAPRAVLPRATCDGNTASNRSVWCDYDTSTDYYTDGPDTGVEVEVGYN